jgi:hypothetical protein
MFIEPSVWPPATSQTISGRRVFELAAIHDHRGIRKAAVLAGVVDVRMRVQHVADVTGRDVVLRQLVLEPLVALDQPDHPEPPEDLGARDACINEYGIVASEDEITPAFRPRHLPNVVRQHEKACLDLDVDKVEESDLVRHASFPDQGENRWP